MHLATIYRRAVATLLGLVIVVLPLASCGSPGPAPFRVIDVMSPHASEAGVAADAVLCNDRDPLALAVRLDAILR